MRLPMAADDLRAMAPPTTLVTLTATAMRAPASALALDAAAPERDAGRHLGRS
jgi:hypothetical protein